MLAVAAEEEAREVQVARDAELARRGSAEGGGENEAPSMVASTIGTASIMGNTTFPKSALEDLAAERGAQIVSVLAGDGGNSNAAILPTDLGDDELDNQVTSRTKWLEYVKRLNKHANGESCATGTHATAPIPI